MPMDAGLPRAKSLTDIVREAKRARHMLLQQKAEFRFVFQFNVLEAIMKLVGVESVKQQGLNG